MNLRVKLYEKYTCSFWDSCSTEKIIIDQAYGVKKSTNKNTENGRPTYKFIVLSIFFIKDLDLKLTAVDKIDIQRTEVLLW